MSDEMFIIVYKFIRVTSEWQSSNMLKMLASFGAEFSGVGSRRSAPRDASDVFTGLSESPSDGRNPSSLHSAQTLHWGLFDSDLKVSLLPIYTNSYKFYL